MIILKKCRSEKSTLSVKSCETCTCDHLLKVTAPQNVRLRETDKMYAKCAYGGGPILTPTAADFVSRIPSTP